MRRYAVDTDDIVMIDRQSGERLGTLPVILAYFDEADVAIPPLVVAG